MSTQLSLLSEKACSNCGLRYGASNTREIPPLSPAVESFLQTNDPVLSPEEHTLRTMLHEAESMASDIDLQIVCMQDSITRLSEQRAKIKQHIQAYKTVLHPIRELPFEVLQHIFRFCMAEEHPIRQVSIAPSPDCLPITTSPSLPISSTSSIDTRKSPWRLGQVSRTWRFVTTKSPTLWSTISVLGSTNRNALPFLLSLQLQRSGDMPLSVTIGPQSPTDTIALLCSHAPRWKFLCAALRTKQLVALASLVCGPLPLLETVAIGESERLGNLNDMPDMPFSFQLSPRLRCFKSYGIPGPLSIALPLEGLTTLSHRSPRNYNSDHFALLKEAKNLQYAELLCLVDPSGVVPQTMVSHTSLRGLYVHSQRRIAQDIVQFLDQLVLPALTELDIRVGTLTAPSDTAEDSILQFMKRSSPPLEICVLPDLAMSDTAAPQLFEALPHVRKLGLYKISKEGIAAILWNEKTDVRPLLPKLEYLALYGPQTSAFIDLPLLVHVVSSRQRNLHNHITCSSLLEVELERPLDMTSPVL